MARHPETEASRSPNSLLIRARGRLRSPRGGVRPMARPEMADAVNVALDELYPGRNLAGFYVDARWIGKLERGEHYWASAERRAALRKVTGAATDQELGLHKPRQADRGVIAQILTGAPDDEVRPGADRAVPVEDAYPVEPEQGGVNRRAVLAGGLVAALLTAGGPAMSLDDLDRFEKIADDARRYLDSEVVTFLSDCLRKAASDDGLHGPWYALPSVLGICSVVRRTARTADSAVRGPLLEVGARAAEFAGWLYRDCGQSAAADYWRDRATEWAMEAFDFAMPGYVLIKKSQSAWDDRDAARMLGLAEAVQQGPWRLPSRVMAEAVQQQARGFAMLDLRRQLVDDTLEKAQEILALDAEDGTPLAPHYDAALFKVQTAICYSMSGRPDEAADIYESTLTSTIFSVRDMSYFSTLKAQALAAAHRPDEAAEAGAGALPGAIAVGSARTVRELVRLRNHLQPWRKRPAVHSFIRMMEAA